MPYKITRSGKKWCVVKGGKGKSGGKFSSGHKFGCHSSRAKAKRQLSAIHAHEDIVARTCATILSEDELENYPYEAWITLNDDEEICGYLIDENTIELDEEFNIVPNIIKEVIIWTE